MITLQRPDPKVNVLMGEKKGVEHGDIVRPSQFTIPFEFGKKKVVLNTFTDHVVETDCFDLFKDRKEIVYDENDREMRALIGSDFIVKTDFDEVSKFTGMIPILRKMERSPKGFSGYTILPTTSCNARCVYCYELDLKHETMTDEIVEQTIRYILMTMREGSVVGLHWFGGEPLVGERIIDRICEGLREADVKYSANMISNGSLMTEKMAEKAKEDWHLNSVQITLDGREEVYCERKRYVAFEGSPYRAAINGIHALLDQEIRVSIRLNVDEENLDELMALVDELEQEFEKESRVSVYCHGIFAEDGDERDSDELYSGMAKLNERISVFNKNRQANIENDEEISQEPIDDSNIQWETEEDRCPEDEEIKEKREAEKEGKRYYDRRGHLRRYYCMVDSPMAGPVILPNGRLTLCEHIGELPEVGSVYDEVPFKREDFIDRGREKIEKCRRCSLLPVCTDFTGCPTEARDCFEETMIKQRNNIRGLEDEDRLPPVTIKVEDKIYRVSEPTKEFIEENAERMIPSYHKVDETVSCDEATVMLGDA